MEDFYKYIQVSQEYTFEDLRVVNAGHTRIERGSSYPPNHHPAHYKFDFQQGRVIDEYQLIYISEGRGVLETQYTDRNFIKAGEGFIIFPGVWHRYRPDFKLGWTENWVGFKGTNSLLTSSSHLLSKESPVFRIGLDDSVSKLFNEVYERVKTEVVGSEYALSGAVIHLLGYILTILQRQKLKITSRTDEIILTSKSILESQFSAKVDLEDIAERLKISYAWFRKYFKKNTGFSPYDYLLNIRINHAKILLKNSGRSVKEISQSSGFESQQQFSRTFRNKTGLTPVQFRKQSRPD